jgi:hypothetical protein
VINACAGLGALEDGRLVHKQFILVAMLTCLWGIVRLTCRQM